MPRHSTQEQRMAELQHLMALPPQGLLQLAGDEIENRWPRAPALRTVREAEHSGRGVDSALRLAYETLIELDAGVDEEGMRMLVALEKRLSKRGRRANPPLSEHMEHNKLEDIAELLASRIIAETMTGRNGVFILGDFIYELSSQIRIQLRDAGVDDRILDLLTASETVRSLFKGNGPLARMFPQHVGRSVR